MTTICWDGKILAADSKASQGADIAMINDVQKIHTPGPDEYWDIMGQRILAFGLAGSAQDLFWVKEELNKGVTHKTQISEANDLDFLIIAVDENGTAWYWGWYRGDRKPNGRQVLNPTTGPCTGGTGNVIAQAVLSTGAGAVKAIEQAIRLDNHSGGSVQTWTFPGKPEVPSKRPPPKPELKDVLSPEEMTTLIKETALEVHMRLLKQREEINKKLDADVKALEEPAPTPAANDAPVEPTEIDNAAATVTV